MLRKPQGYQPPKDFWKEVDELDTQIADLATHESTDRALGIFPVRRYRTQWEGEQENTRCYWNSDRVLGIAKSSLWIGELVTVDPQAEGLSTESGEMQTGMIGRRLTYFANTHRRRLEEDYGQTPDITQQPIDTSRTAISRTLDEQFGLRSPGEEAYETLIAELRRGATGEHQFSSEPKD